MDIKKPQLSNISMYTSKENAQKNLEIILNYSKNANKNKDCIGHPQSMLKDDLKRELGCKTYNVDKRYEPMNREFTNGGSIPSINSVEINEFIDKYICQDKVNHNSNTNIITLNPDEVVRMKAGGPILSKQRKRHSKRNENGKNTKNDKCKEARTENVRNEKAGPSNNDKADSVTKQKLIRMKVPVFHGPCCKAMPGQQNLIAEKNNTEKEQDFMQNSLMDAAIDKFDNKSREQEFFQKSLMSSAIEKFDKHLELEKHNASESYTSKSSDKHISFAAAPLYVDNSSGNTTEDATDKEGKVKEGTKMSCKPTKSKLTITEFDRIFNAELKKRRAKSNRDSALSTSCNTNCPMDHIRIEPASTVKASLIHSVVTVLPNDIIFTKDYDLMNAIDKFIQAENACKFEEALRAAEVAAKLAPPGFEEEAAASAARNYQFYSNNQDNYHSLPLDRKKKPIEIVAYVGSTICQK